MAQLAGVGGLALSAGRLQGMTSNANTLGTFSGLLLVACIAGLLRFRRSSWHWWWLVSGCALMSGISLLLTHSRSAAGGAAVGLLLIVWAARRHGLIIVVLAATIALGFVTEYRQALFDSVDVEGLIAAQELNLETREQVWIAQFDAWQRAPIFGHGWELRWGADAGRVGGEGSYLDLLSAVGLIGFVPFMLIIIGSIVPAFKLARTTTLSQEERHWSLVVLGLLGTIFVNSIGEGFLSAVGSSITIYAWVAAGAVHIWWQHIHRPNLRLRG